MSFLLSLCKSVAKVLVMKERKEKFTNLSNMDIKSVYTPEDVKNIEDSKDIGLPCEFPFTRGIHQTMYRGRLWTMRQFSGFGAAEDTNKRFKYLLKHGETGLSTAFDMPTLMGYDSDNPRAAGEVGVCGVAIDTIADMEILFDGIPLDEVTVSMTINAPASILLSMYIAVADKKGIPLNKLGGTTQNDMLKEYTAQKEWIFPPEPSLRLITDTIIYCARNLPKWHPISISGYHIREAGSTAVQELAFTLYDGLTYVEGVIKRGLSIDEFAPRLSFFFNSHNDFFEEIAKFRAARRIWAREIKKRYNPKDERSMTLRFHTQTAGCSLTAQQPYNNIVRVTLQALSAVLGGTQSLHTDSMDETYAIPTEEAVRIALRTQQIIAHESGVTNTIDPLGGSYYIENLTNKMEDAVYEYFKKLDDMGGMVSAIEKGFPQKEIKESAYSYQKEIDSKERLIVGVNDFIEEEKAPVEVFKTNPDVERKQIQRLKDIKGNRDKKRLKMALEDLKRAAHGDENLMPFIIEAVKSYATIGEICDVLKEVLGTYKEPIV
ncbi:MAG: methylmalonyl-CoA mutase [Nitrospinae bacterium RIFCSPLOWO2_12_39_16]|nr:MAG: methylmalonyl-CoA mutase [Nitrospinae bacterium RIFCSPLOWO2_02_39_17]OGW11536.1 MAG: methylmalonyl-CoA mutase [Nitrospinae bacterium RIFCSPLOWO2_12_39_16]